jgi:type IV secretory pathway VirJ component
MTRLADAVRCRTRALRLVVRVVPVIVMLGAVGAVGCDGHRPAQPTGGPPVNAASHAFDNGSVVADLPLIEVPATAATGMSGTFAVMLTGDGGWAPADRGISKALAAHGVPVVGLSSPRYLASARTPEETARDLARILRHYSAVWGRSRVAVIGYSRGADLAPFMVSRLPDDLRGQVVLVALLGPSAWAGFQFHIVDLVMNTHRDGDLPVAPEIEHLRGTPVLCIYGRRDRDAICPTLDATVAPPIVRNGGHAVAGREGAALADTILRALPRAR